MGTERTGFPALATAGARCLGASGTHDGRGAVTRTKPAGQRRAELLAAGRALFLAKGVTATSLDDITQRAGVSKGLFYLYFPSKEALVLALREQFSHEIAARMRTAAEAEADWTARLDACVRAGFECHRDLHDLHVLFRHTHPPRRDPRALLAPGGTTPPSPPEAQLAPGGTTPRTLPRTGGPTSPYPPEPPEAGPAATRVIAELLAAGTAAGAFDVADPDATAVLCYASMHAFDPGFRDRGGADDARLIRAAQQLFRRAAGVT
jgi:TetR/AcrR family transcriptional regulator, transcriptional repressor for nem operon